MLLTVIGKINNRGPMHEQLLFHCLHPVVVVVAFVSMTTISHHDDHYFLHDHH
jgi:hypothetical protein